MRVGFSIIVLILVLALSCTLFAFAEGTQDANQGQSLPITLEIHKIDGGTELPIADAVFVLSKEDGYYLGNSTADAKPLWTEDETAAFSLVTDENGTIVLKGLLPGLYYLKETSAPQGYLLLEEPIKIQITAEYGADDLGNQTIIAVSACVNDGDLVSGEESEPNRVVIHVENVYDTVLPETGGIGTSIYYIFGFVILFAISLVVAAKRLIPEV